MHYCIIWMISLCFISISDHTLGFCVFLVSRCFSVLKSQFGESQCQEWSILYSLLTWSAFKGSIQIVQKYIGITLIVDLGRFTLNNDLCSLLIMCVPTPPQIFMQSWLDLDILVNCKVNMQWTSVTLMEANLPFIKKYEYSLLTISYHCFELVFAFVIQTKTWNLTTITRVMWKIKIKK